jgi:ketosteroid isomerase-like protein
MTNREQIVRESYVAFAAGDRRFFEERLSDDFLFSAPPDPRLDRAGYFERCRPGAGRGQNFELARLIESGDAVIVTYETENLHRPQRSEYGSSPRRRRQDHPGRGYFGWDLD